MTSMKTEKQTYVHLPVYKEMEMNYLWPLKQKIITPKLYETMRWSYSWKEILNDGPCAMNLTNSFKTLSNKIEDVYKTKLKTDS
jgi:hypothetical protein